MSIVCSFKCQCDPSHLREGSRETLNPPSTTPTPTEPFDEDYQATQTSVVRRHAVHQEHRCSKCDKTFKRSCDLSKHQKTHSRPWKCSEPNCKYHEYGWPTEKECDRHFNDKHSAAPLMYKCLFPPCLYESKRESNRKQHMEKVHGWNFNRKAEKRRAGLPLYKCHFAPCPYESTRESVCNEHMEGAHGWTQTHSMKQTGRHVADDANKDMPTEVFSMNSDLGLLPPDQATHDPVKRDRQRNESEFRRTKQRSRRDYEDLEQPRTAELRRSPPGVSDVCLHVVTLFPPLITHSRTRRIPYITIPRPGTRPKLLRNSGWTPLLIRHYQQLCNACKTTQIQRVS